MIKAILGSGWKSATGLFLSLWLAPRIGDTNVDQLAGGVEAVGNVLAIVGVSQKVITWLSSIASAIKNRPKV